LKQPLIEITNEQINQELDMWFNNEECEALARETGFIQRSTSRLTGSSFFNLLTVEAVDEPTISYEGLCDILEERNPNSFSVTLLRRGECLWKGYFCAGG
jgi:hypothetical protein